VGHRGSKNSTTADFLAAVQPRIAIVSSSAENPYGHPSAQLIERFDNAGVRIFRRDRGGAVRVLSDRIEVTGFVDAHG
jgi:competence protein ComEC